MADMEAVVVEDLGLPDFFICEGCKEERKHNPEDQVCPCCQGYVWAQFDSVPKIAFPAIDETERRACGHFDV